MNKEGFAIVSTFKRLPYLLWGGVAILCDNRKLAYIFGANGALTFKAVAQRPQGWRVFLGQFSYTIGHIPGDENCWGELLSRWVARPGGPTCVHVSVKYAEVLFAESEKFPTKEIVRGVKAAAAGDGPILDPALGVAFLDSEGLCTCGVPRPPCGLGAGRGQVSEAATAGVCPPGGTGHRGVDATMARLERHCIWEDMDRDVWDMTRLCLYCADTKAGVLVPRTLKETPHR